MSYSRASILSRHPEGDQLESTGNYGHWKGSLLPFRSEQHEVLPFGSILEEYFRFIIK